MGTLLFLSPLLAQTASGHPRSQEQPAADCPVNPAPAPPEIAIDSPFAGKPWRLTELTGETLPDEPAAPYLLFTNTGELMGFGGCNYFLGKYRIGDEGRVIVSTLRASHQECSEFATQERNLLTSLLMANTIQMADDKLTFLMNASNLMTLGAAPDIAVDELMQQSKLLKVQKKRHHKTRSKKKKAATKSKKTGKAATPKVPGKTRPVVKTPVKSK